MSVPTIYNPKIKELDNDLTDTWFIGTCRNLGNYIDNLCLGNNIYPWEVEEYSKLGIKQFKLIGRNSKDFLNGDYLKFFLQYLKGIDNYKNIEEFEFKYLVHHYILQSWKFKVKDIKPYLPNIKHFIKKGHLCSSICLSECNYCYKCMENIKKHLKDYI